MTTRLHDKALLPKSFTIGLLSTILVPPHLEDGIPACSPNPLEIVNHLELIQALATRQVTHLRHLSYEERL